MKQYLDPKPKNFEKTNQLILNPKENQDLINTILFIIESFGIPVDQEKLFKKSRKNGSIFFSCMWNKKNRRVKRMLKDL